MVEATQDEKYEAYIYDFSAVINTSLGNQANLQALGRSRVSVQGQLVALQRTAELQLEAEYQIKLFQSVGRAFSKVGEHGLAQESYTHIVESLTSQVEDVVRRNTLHAEAVYALASSRYTELTESTGSRAAPIVISKLVSSLRDLHKALIDIFDLTVSQQEELSWLILNGCKLILKLSQPLVWLSCGKYVADVLLFSALCMESVVNLCTTRHLKFRMKLYVTAFYNTMVYGSEDDSQRYLAHIVQQVENLRSQEELDLPIPEKTEIALLEAEVDLATMKAIMNCWLTPDKFGGIADEEAIKAEFGHPGAGAEEGSLKAGAGNFFRERVLAEFVRVQQLTSGNRNEVWRRRCVGVMSGFRAYFETVKLEPPSESERPAEGEAAEEGEDEDAPEPDAELEADGEGAKPVEEPAEPEIERKEEATMRLVRNCVIELLSMNLFCPNKKEEEDDDIKIGADTQKDVLAFLVDNVAHSYGSSEVEAGSDFLKMVKSLHSLVQVERRESQEFILSTFSFVQSLDECLSKDNLRLKRSVLVQTAINIWDELISPNLQKALSNQSSTSPDELKYYGPSLLALFKVFNSSQVDDPVMLSSMSLLVGKVYSQFNDYRTAISVLSRALDNIDKQRASRVDLKLHTPVDSTDISALQHSSFTSQNDAQDWFNSIKRLGAHAFAGFGIFGSASVAERTDHALAEIHTETTMLYMRCEVQYAMARKRAKKALKYYKHDKAFYEKHSHNRIKFSHKTSEEKASSEPTIPICSSFYKPENKSTTDESDPGALDEEYKTNTDNLRIKSVLKRWCVENSQAQALLCVELAQVDSRPACQIKHIEAAKALIAEGEQSEKELKESQASLTVMSGSDFRAPVTLARSHGFLYAVPVASEKHANKAAYYRLFAKEDLHGSLVTLGNDELSGSEVKVALSTYRKRDAVTKCSIRVAQLKWGKKYVLASVAFDENGKNVGKIGPTSVAVEAKNPLSNVLLWFHVYRVATKIEAPNDSSHELAEYAAVQICNFYFYPSRIAAEPKPFTIGKGKNVFIGTDIVLSMLKVQLSSNVQLVSFIEAFLYLVEREDKHVPTRVRRDAQSQVISHLRTVGKVTLLAAYCGAADLVARCATMGHSLASSLLFADDANIASELQNPLTQLVVAMQNTPKKNWELLEHKIYCRLLSELVRVAVINRNVAPVLAVVDVVFMEEVDTALLKFLKKEDERSQVESDYFCLQSTIWKKRMYLSSVAGEDKDVVTPFENIFTAPVQEEEEEDKDLFFRSTISRRAFMILKDGVSPLADGSSAILPYLSAETKTVSDTLFAALQVCKVVATSDAEDKGEVMAKIFEATKVPKPKVASGVVQLLSEWDITLFEMIEPEPEAEPEAEAEAEGEDGEAPKPMEKEPETISDEEEKRQLFCLAEIMFLRAQFVLHPKLTSSRNLKPEGKKGPDSYVDITAGSPLVETMQPAAEEKGEEEGDVPPTGDDDTEKGSASLPYISHLCCAVIMFSQADFPSSGVHVVVTLWNHVVEYWVSPEAFAKSYSSLKTHLPHFSASLASILTSSVVDNVPEESAFAESMGRPEEVGAALVAKANVGAVQAMHIESSREYLYCCQELILYIVQVHWLYEQFADLVSASSQCLSVYLHTENADLVKLIGESCSPISIEAQSRIIQRVEGKLSGVNMRMTTCTDAFAATMKLKRRKKKRLTSTEKDDDELAHEAEVEEINGEIDAVQAVLDNEKDRLAGLMALQKRYEGTLSTGLQLMYKVSANTKGFVSKFYADKDSKREVEEMAASNAPVSAMSPTVRDAFEDLMDEYHQLSDFLREKQDRMTLIEALNEQGDVILLCGFIETARKIFHDSLDGYFNVMDAYKDYSLIVSKEMQKVSQDGDGTALKGLVYSIVVLGKLSKYCATNDWDSKLDYCRFAADLCRVPFLESFSHPLNLSGFAAYVCSDVGGIASFVLETDRKFVASLSLALSEIVETLTICDLRIEALPAVVLLEHVHMVYTRRADLWVSARVTRIKLLISAHLFAEAASMIAGIKSSLAGLMNLDIEKDEDELIEAHRIDTKENVIDFFGLDAFYNHLLPTSEENQKALAWIEGFSTDIRAYIAEEEAKINERNGVVEGEEGESQKTRLLSPQQLDDLSALSARFFVELCLLENLLQAEHSGDLASLSTRGMALIDAIVGDGASAPEEASIQDGSWVSLRSALVFMKVDTMVQQRKYMPARHLLLNLAELLKLDKGARDQEKKTLVWFQVRDKLADIAERQARWKDTITVATQGMGETAITSCSLWTRRFAFRRAYSYYQMGEFENCMSDLHAVCTSFEEQNFTDGLYLRSLSLKAAIVMDFAASDINGLSGPLRDVGACIEGLEKARGLAERMCSVAGYLGADSNVTFFDIDNNVTKNTYFSPLLHNLTDVQQNAQNLFVRRTQSLNGYTKKEADVASHGDDPITGGVEPFRLGPIDSEDVDKVTKSKLANVYLTETRNLAACLSALVVAYANFDSFAEHKQWTAGSLPDTDESGLKVMRYVPYVSPQIRSSLLQGVGSTRPKRTEGTAKSVQDDILPLLASLNNSMKNFHDWNSMRSTCLRVADLLSESMDSNNALKFVLCAIKLKNKLNVVDKNLLAELNEDASFSTNVVDDNLSNLIKTAALTAPNLDARSLAGPSDSTHKVCGADAVFLLSSMLREFDSLWYDAPIRNTYYDVCSILGKSSALFKEKCILTELPSIEDSSAPEVPSMSLSTMWVQSEDAGESTPSNPFSQAFSQVVAYFVMGPSPDGSGSPVLRKQTFLRSAISSTKKRVLKLRRDMMRSLAPMETLADDARALVTELANSSIVDNEGERKPASIAVSLNEDASGISFELKGAVVGTIAVDEQFLLGLADVFSIDKDLMNIESEDLYKFVHNVLQM